MDLGMTTRSVDAAARIQPEGSKEAILNPLFISRLYFPKQLVVCYLTISMYM